EVAAGVGDLRMLEQYQERLAPHRVGHDGCKPVPLPLGQLLRVELRTDPRPLRPVHDLVQQLTLTHTDVLSLDHRIEDELSLDRFLGMVRTLGVDLLRVLPGGIQVGLTIRPHPWELMVEPALPRLDLTGEDGLRNRHIAPLNEQVEQTIPRLPDLLGPPVA